MWDFFLQILLIYLKKLFFQGKKICRIFSRLVTWKLLSPFCIFSRDCRFFLFLSRNLNYPGMPNQGADPRYPSPHGYPQPGQIHQGQPHGGYQQQQQQQYQTGPGQYQNQQQGQHGGIAVPNHDPNALNSANIAGGHHN